MSVMTSTRRATSDEIVSEMDRRGLVIEKLEAELREARARLAEAEAQARLARLDALAEAARIAEADKWNDTARHTCQAIARDIRKLAASAREEGK